MMAVGETNPARKKMAPADRKDRKEWSKCHKRIHLSNTIFHSWIEPKYSAGCGSCSDSDFSAHLLSLEYGCVFVLLTYSCSSCNINVEVHLFSCSCSSFQRVSGTGIKRSRAQLLQTYNRGYLTNYNTGTVVSVRVVTGSKVD